VKRNNLHIQPSPFTNATRILRITDSLAKAGVFDKIYIIAMWKEGLPEIEDIDNIRQVWRVRPKLSQNRKGNIWKLMKLFEWTIRILWRFRRMNIKCVNPHCVSALPMAVWFKRTNKNCKIVYDAHEIETETIAKVGLMKPISKFIEKKCMPYIDVINLTSDGHADWYKKEYSLKNVRVIKNFPYRRNENFAKGNIFRERFNIKDNEILYIYQGDLSRARGTDNILRVFAKVSPDKHIVFMGFGDYVELVKDYESKYPNIHFFPGVKPHEVVKHTSSADIGVHMLEDTCINHHYALPNKPLEYLNSGIPAIVSDLPDMGALVEEEDCGWRVQIGEEYLAELIEKITKEDIIAKSSNARKWAKNHTWEGEEKKLLEIYHELIGYPVYSAD